MHAAHFVALTGNEQGPQCDNATMRQCDDGKPGERDEDVTDVTGPLG